ncbi:hypothetical protein B0T22DRAFT_461996 [Podospora appendiculata]|uniref:N-acetylgalactosaminide beta-1,3-galactosyltransferase n=1 Tax=Podospora appendiculata TaxID=314037 RepID=A0AAE0XBM0_9PEZI|nr:hypothetical protein B0T22DRAFT_461996 [Podospora appendiculata]
MHGLFSSAAGLQLNRRLVRATMLVLALLLAFVLGAWAIHQHLTTLFANRNGGSQTQTDPALSPFSLLDLNENSQPTSLPNFYPFETTSAFFPIAQDDIEFKTVQELCGSFPNHLVQRIQPVLKMGHGEDPEKIDAQLGSVSACFGLEELLVFSDLNDTIRGRHVIDVLANLPRAYRTNNTDFDNYEAMYELQRSHKLTAGNDPARGKNGWRLDKYKFLAEVERAWLMRPGRDWYCFFETDTYIVWDNMFRFLSILDPAAPLYMGSPSPGRFDEENKIETWFANGGPGFVLSRGAMEKLMARRSSASGEFTEAPLTLKGVDLVRNDCCGDSMLGWILWKAGIPLSGFFPMFNTYPTHSIPFTARTWCQPVLTMHKTSPEDMVELWRWEHGRRKLGRPLLYSDLYEFRQPDAQAIRLNWDNTNWDRLGPGHDVEVNDLKSCTKACDAEPECLQYLWRGEHMKQCVLMPFINFGLPRKPEWQILEEKFNYTSGWISTKILTWLNEHECERPDWVSPSTERHY